VSAFEAAVREGELRAGGSAGLAEARALGTRARAALALVRGDGSFGVHAPQEAARLLAEAIDDARLAQAKVVAAAGGASGAGAGRGGGDGARRSATSDPTSRRAAAADSAPADSAKPAFELPAVTP
jgi:hypothetical protein